MDPLLTQDQMSRNSNGRKNWLCPNLHASDKWRLFSGQNKVEGQC